MHLAGGGGHPVLRPISSAATTATTRLFNDAVGDFRFSFEYYYAHIMRPFRAYVREALELIEPLPLKMIAPGHGPILRHEPRDYVRRYRTLSAPSLHGADSKTLLVFYISAYGATRRMAEAVAAGAEAACDGPAKCASRSTTSKAGSRSPSST
jgi:flavorubredoxin